MNLMIDAIGSVYVRLPSKQSENNTIHVYIKLKWKENVQLIHTINTIESSIMYFGLNNH